MNFALMEQIIRHLNTNLGVMATNQVDMTFSRALRSQPFLLPDKLTFELPDGQTSQNQIWGCQFKMQEQLMQILVGDCTQEANVPEFAVLIHLTGAPTYGTYLVYNDWVNNCLSDPLIAVMHQPKSNWMVCETYLQATFLAGMEQIRDVAFGWSKATNYQDNLQMLNSFIKYHSVFYGDHEG